MTTVARISSVVTERYARAIVELAEEKKVLNKVEADLVDLGAMLSQSDDLISFTHNPSISKKTQKETLLALAKKAQFQDLTVNFLNVLVQNKRLNALEQILKAVSKMLAKQRGEKVAQVTVAQDLSDKQRKDLEASLSKSAGATVSLEIKVDPSILGGAIITMDSKMIDDSVVRKLERLKFAMGSGANTNQNLSEVS